MFDFFLTVAATSALIGLKIMKRHAQMFIVLIFLDLLVNNYMEYTHVFCHSLFLASIYTRRD